MGEQTLECGKCGASLVVPPGCDRVVCQFCGSETLLTPEPAAAPRTLARADVATINKWMLGIVALVVLAPLLCFGLCAGGILSSLRGSDAGQVALARARSDAAGVAALGTPIKEGYFVSGSASDGGDSGHADLQIPVSGPKASGTLYVVADLHDGEWVCRKLHLIVSGTGEQIDLLKK